MEREAVFAAVAAERRSVADVVAQLDENGSATPSLCAGWDVKTVAAHLISVFADSFWTFQWAALRYRGYSRAIDARARHHARIPTADLARILRDRAEHRLSPPVTGPLSGLTDVLVHGGDIRIPLGIPFEPDVDRVSAALDFLTGPHPLGFVPRGRLRGLALCADGIDRTWGAGAEVHGPARWLMMAAAGRIEALRHLDGPGVSLLDQRLRGG